MPPTNEPIERYASFNINETVKVRPTEAGWKILDESDADLRRIHKNYKGYRYHLDPQGFLHMQMWELMQVFGPYCGCGHELCFETEIFIKMESLYT